MISLYSTNIKKKKITNYLIDIKIGYVAYIHISSIIDIKKILLKKSYK